MQNAEFQIPSSHCDLAITYSEELCDRFLYKSESFVFSRLGYFRILDLQNSK